MSKLPVISGCECVTALEKAGFYFKRQGLEEANYEKNSTGRWIPPRLIATELVSMLSM